MIRDEAKIHCRQTRACENPPTGCGCLCDDCCEANLTEIGNWWAEVLDDRIPGTRRRWHQRRDTLEQATERAARDHVEREARFGANSDLPRHLRPRVITPPGQSPSPARDDVLDAVATVTWNVIELRNEVGQRFNSTTPKIGVREACEWVKSALPQISEPAYRRDIARKTLDTVRVVRAATGRTEDVIQLDAGCPICGGETLLAYASRMSVTCIGDECVCDLHDCGCQRGYKHTWTEKELVWLARVLHAEEDTA